MPKLQLGKETLRVLNHTEGRVAGGDAGNITHPTMFGCPTQFGCPNTEQVDPATLPYC